MSLFHRHKHNIKRQGAVFVEEIEAPDGETMAFEGATEDEARDKADEFMRWAWGDEVPG